MASSTLTGRADKIAAGYAAMVPEYVAEAEAMKLDPSPHAATLAAAYAAFASGYAAAGAAAHLVGAELPFPLLPLDSDRSALSSLDVMTLPDVVDYLQLSEQAVRTEAVAGRLVGRAVGDDWRFVREDVLKWVRTPRPSSPSPTWTPEVEAECEREIAAIYGARRELGTVADHFPDEGDE